MEERFIPAGGSPEASESLDNATYILFQYIEEAFQLRQQAAEKAGRLPDPLYLDTLPYIQQYLQYGYIEAGSDPRTEAINVLSMIQLKLRGRLIPVEPEVQALSGVIEEHLIKLYQMRRQFQV